MKLPATTIVESIVAMLVVMISFTAGMSLYLTILRGDAFPLRTKAHNALHNAFETTKKEQRYLDETINSDGLTIQKRLRPYRAYEVLEHRGVYQLTLEAYDPERQRLATHHHLIRLPYED